MSGSALSHRDKSSTPPGFEDVDKLKNSSGIVAVISRRKSDGLLTFALFREWEGPHGEGRTAFQPEHNLAAYKKMVGLVESRLAELQQERAKAATR